MSRDSSVKNCPVGVITPFHDADTLKSLCIGSSIYCSVSTTRELSFYSWKSQSYASLHLKHDIISTCCDASDGVLRTFGLSSSGRLFCWQYNGDSLQSSEGDAASLPISPISAALVHTFPKVEWQTVTTQDVPIMTVDDTVGLLVIVLQGKFIHILGTNFLMEKEKEKRKKVRNKVSKVIIENIPMDVPNITPGKKGDSVVKNDENASNPVGVTDGVNIRIDFDRSSIVGGATDPVCCIGGFPSDCLEFEESRVCIGIETWLDIWRININVSDRSVCVIPLSDDVYTEESNENYKFKYAGCSSVRVETEHTGWISAISPVYYPPAGLDEVGNCNSILVFLSLTFVVIFRLITLSLNVKNYHGTVITHSSIILIIFLLNFYSSLCISDSFSFFF